MFKLWFVCLVALFSLSASASSDPRGDILAIGAGSSVANGSYAADEDFSGGSPYPTTIPIDTSHVSNPAPVAVYQNCRFGNFSYTIPGLAAGGAYLIRLHFAEVYWTAAGARVFNVSINGHQVLSNFDIVATSGGKGIADVQQFQAGADAMGRISIQFSTVVDNAMVNGIEIQAAGTLPFPTPTPSYNLSLSSNQATYVAGTKATILATLTAAPANPAEEFFVSASFNGNPIALTAITKNESYAITPALAAGASLFMAQVYLQNTKEAQAIGRGISFYQGDIAKLQAELAVTTDPNAISTINALIQHDQDRLAAALAELGRIRTPVGAAVTISVTAQ